MFSYDALQILVFLIPGFMASAVLSSLAVRGYQKTDLERVLEALVFSLLIYAGYAIIRQDAPLRLVQDNGQVLIRFDPTGFATLVAVTLLLPAAISMSITNDWHMRAARALRVTRRTSRSSVWFDVFYDLKRNIVVEFADGRRLYGWPMYYSDDPSQRYLFIHKPSWIVGKKIISTGLEGMLVTPEEKIEFIGFLPE